tara:strand:- start:375 stop:752 length:378 start_codon:yes stop_codon:yes gene_type:complete
MGVKEFLSKSLKKDPRFKELETEMKMQKLLEERQKSSNERELERFYEEEREKSIKQNLEEFRKKQQEKSWHGDNILDTPNIFKERATMLDNGKSILDNGNSILKQKNIFKAKSKPKKKGGMFFKK